MDAAGALGVVTALTVITFGAYVLGLVMLALPSLIARRGIAHPAVSPTSLNGLEQRVVREIRGARIRGVSFDELVGQFEPLAMEERDRMSEDERFEDAAIALDEDPTLSRSVSDLVRRERWDWLESDAQVKRIALLVLDELALAELSLQVSSRDVYDKYDRVCAESEFRMAVAAPLTGLGVALAVRLGWEYQNWLAAISLLLVIPAALLLASGRRRAIEARDLMVQAVLGGQAVSPTLKLILDLQPKESANASSSHI